MYALPGKCTESNHDTLHPSLAAFTCIYDFRSSQISRVFEIIRNAGIIMDFELPEGDHVTELGLKPNVIKAANRSVLTLQR
jgi:hypothetical protein